MNQLSTLKRTLAVASMLTMMAGSALASDNHSSTYVVTITNITKGISFTPFLAATHRQGINLFETGSVASTELAIVAEGGDVAPMRTMLDANQKVIDSATSAGLLNPGQSVSLEIEGGKYPAKNGKLSLVAMLLPTNDSFIALDSVALPHSGSKTYFANAYDSGTELNDENCTNIPGPACGGEGYAAEGGEGYIYPAPGIHGEGELSRAMYDWSGPVAKVMIKRID